MLDVGTRTAFDVPVDLPVNAATVFAVLEGALDLLEEPGDLGAGEIRIEDQAGLLFEGGLPARVLEFPALRRGSAVLPDDRAMNRLSILGSPERGGFPLVGDSDSGDGGWYAYARQLQRWDAR